ASVAADATRMNLQLAAHLLNHPTARARYVCVMDGGLTPAKDAGGYDTHELNCPTQARNLSHTLAALMEIVRMPGEDAPDKLDLDKTMIVISTEFGRTPEVQGEDG